MSISAASVCSGIGAPEVAMPGWRWAWCAEVDPFPSAIKAVALHQWPAQPSIPNLGDMTTIAARISAGDIEPPDALIGGTPCQDFSIAGLRLGLDGPRGNLTMEFIRLADAIDAVRRARGLPPCIILWENVPGVLSHKRNPFGCFLSGLAGEDTPIHAPRGGWTDAGVVHGPERAAAWRVLDAQYFGLAQRRRRIFVVASARNGFDPGAVLLEWEGVRRDSPPRREAREDAAPGAGRRSEGSREPFDAGRVITSGLDGGRVARALNACPTAAGRFDISVDTFVAEVAPIIQASGKAAGSATQQDAENGMLVAVGFQTKGTNVGVSHDVFGTLMAKDGRPSGDTPLVCIHGTQDPDVLRDQAHTLGRNHGQENAVVLPIAETGKRTGRSSTDWVVRRLTPTECERLQGFPDGWTAIPWRGSPAAGCPDGRRYRALGNSMAVPVMRWILSRVEAALAGLS